MLHSISHSFNGGNITSEGGSLILHTFLQQIGLKKALTTLFPEKKPTAPGRPKQYSKAKNITDLITGYMKGHATPTALSRTRGDIAQQVISGSQIASQSTFSRRINTLSHEDEQLLRQCNKDLLEQYFKDLIVKNGGKKLPCIEISDDSTKVATYGRQEGSAYITHYRVTGYHPDLITEDTMRLIMEGMLRDGNVYSSTGSEFLIQDVIHIFAPYTEKIIFRGDSAYAKPEILNVLRKAPIKVEYYIKAKTYHSWYEKSEATTTYQGNLIHPLALPQEAFEEEQADGKNKLVARYFSFRHTCNSWSAEERIEAKMEYIFQQQESLLPGIDKKVTMLITNGEQGAKAYRMYGKRGKQEKLIEELKNDSFAGQLSQQKKEQNACLFMIKIIAHNLMQILRLTTLHGTKYANCRVESMRMLLVRVGGKLIRTARRWMLQLSSTFSYQRWFNLVMERIPRIQFRLCT